MKVPRNFVKCGLATGLLLGLCVAARAADKQPSPEAKISLEKLGFAGVSAGFLNAGASVLTVNFLDDEHLLVTFGMRGLVKRMENDPATDEDREVAAEVVELPSGKVVAKTQWHLHDHGRYLWPIGHGRFMVRVGGDLSTIAPLANLHKDPFRRVAFPTRWPNVAAVMVSPDDGVLTVESQIPLQQSSVANWADQQTQQTATVLDFYRVKGEGTEASPLTMTSPHTLRSAQPISFPINEDGYLWATTESRDPSDWTLSFHAFAPAGKKDPMVVGRLPSSCVPRLMMASRSEYVALTCMGMDSSLKLATYGFDGHENWEESMNLDSSIAFVFAPAAGRFALSRIVTVPSVALSSNGVPGDPTFRQEVRVYQTESGDLVLKTTTSPAFKTAENFDLSSDGRAVALVQNKEIVIYRLPAPSERDRKATEEVAKFAPPPGGDADLMLAAIAVHERPGETVAGNAPRVAAPVVPAANVPATADKAAQLAQRVVTNAEAAPARKPPTLLLPGEKAEFKDKRQKQSPTQ